MTSAPSESSRPRALTDVVRARQARRGGGPAAGGSSRVRSAGGEETRGGASTQKRTLREGGGDQSWLSRLLTPLKLVGRKLLDAFDALVGDRAGGLRKLGALAVAGLLARRLPGVLGRIARLVTSILKGERGFRFWWLVSTLAVGALLALVLSPVAALVALLVAGIWMIARRARNKDGEKKSSDRGAESGSDSGGGLRERVAPSAV